MRENNPAGIASAPAPAFILAMLFFLGACGLEPVTAPPFVLGKPVCVIGSREGYYRFAGIEADFHNIARKAAARITVQAIVYDRETGSNPFIGSNLITASFEGDIEANSSAALAVPLDPYLYAVPDEPYLIDFFRVSKIVYADGSSWADRDGLYYTGSE